MRHFLTNLLSFHWAVAFALLAMACVSGGESGAAALLNLSGVTVPAFSEAAVASPALAAFLALCFATVSILFLWALVTSVIGNEDNSDTEPVIRLAFGAASCVLTVVLVGGTVGAVTGLFATVAMHLAALLASYLAVCAERWFVSLADVPDEADIRAAARVMAAGAAHSSMLSRLSGRGDLSLDGGR